MKLCQDTERCGVRSGLRPEHRFWRLGQHHLGGLLEQVTGGREEGKWRQQEGSSSQGLLLKGEQRNGALAEVRPGVLEGLSRPGNAKLCFVPWRINQ